MSKIDIAAHNNYLLNLKDNENNNELYNNNLKSIDLSSLSDYEKENNYFEKNKNSNFIDNNYYSIKSKAYNLRYKNNIRNLFKI